MNTNLVIIEKNSFLKKDNFNSTTLTARWKEDSLRKQIEKYDSLISEGRQEIVRSGEQVHT